MANQTTPSSEFPEIQPTEPTSSTAYIQPVIGKMGWDTRPEYKGLFGLGTSPNNGVDFHVFLSFDGINFDSDDINNIWEKGAKDRVKKEVDSATAEIPAAVSAANDAAKRADSAVANSKANSDAIEAMKSAVDEAQSGADAALSSAAEASKNIGSTAAAIKSDVANVESQVASAQSAAKSDAMTVTATASDAKMIATNANSQALVATATASQAAATISSVESTAASTANQLSDVAKTVQANTVNITATSKELKAKADQATVDSANQKVEELSGQVDVIAGQVDAKADKTDVDELKQTSTEQAAEIKANADGLLAKADKTVTDALTKSYTEQQAQQQILADEMESKVTSADVKGILADGKYATESYTQSIVDQKADTLSSTITEVQKNVEANQNEVGQKISNITQSIDGIQSTVATKADKSQVTQLADTFQVKLQGNIIAEVDDISLKFTDGDNVYWSVAMLQNPQQVTKGTKVYLAFDYLSDTGCTFIPQFDNDPWTPFGDITNPVTAEKGVTGHYFKEITVNDDSWENTKAAYLCIRSDHNSGNFTVTNLTLKAGDNVMSTFDMLKDDVNLRVQKGDLISQINLEAGQTLIQSKKLFLDADTVAFSGKAFIPSAAITSLDADKITSGYIKVPMSDGNGNSVQVSNNGVDIVSNNQNTKLFSANRGTASVHIDAAGMSLGATTNGVYELLGGFSPLLDDTDGWFEGQENHNGIGLVVETQQQYGSPYGGDFFSLARSIKGPPSYYNGFLYEATGSGKHEIGSHFFDPIYVHPWGADNYMHATWVSWTAWDNNEKYPAIVQAGSNMGGICFPKSGEVTLFTASGKSFTPSQWKGVYTGYQHDGAGNAYHDPSQDA